MPPNDVVRRNLNVSSRIDFAGEGEPMPLPLISRPAGRALVNPPTTTMITDPTIDTAPYRSVGKMELFFDPLRSLRASGWVVAPRAFITAGHCVYTADRGGWIIEASFCPRFNLGCSEKSYKVEAVFTLQGWLDNSDPVTNTQYDMGACLVTEPFAGTEPPLAFDLSPLPAFQFAAIGYPGKRIPNYDFNGKRMWQSVGGLAAAGGGTLTAENNLTNGASGGPWCEPQNNWVVSGLTSARITDDLNLAVSPVLGQGFQNLYNAVKDL